MSVDVKFSHSAAVNVPRGQGNLVLIVCQGLFLGETVMQQVVLITYVVS